MKQCLLSEDTLDPLFADENDRNEFRHRHYINKVRKNDIKGVCRECVFRFRYLVLQQLKRY